VALVAASPLALDLFGRERTWAERSEIGQTYGAAAALLSVLALVGISVSLVLQAREAKVARDHASRTTHSELLQMAMQEPAYRECWGPIDFARSDEELRQHAYTNLIVSYWQSRFEVGTFSETHLRAGAAAMFAAAPGRRFWTVTRQVRLQTAHSRRSRRFHRILDEEYEKAVAAGPPASRPSEASATSPPSAIVPRRNGEAVVLLVAGIGIAAAWRSVSRIVARHRAQGC
jgi:hypothetical protein